jgi:hypothetical protein
MKSAFDFDRSHAAFISLRRPPCQAAQLGLRQLIRALHGYRQAHFIVDAAPRARSRTRIVMAEQYEQ